MGEEGEMADEEGRFLSLKTPELLTLTFKHKQISLPAVTVGGCCIQAQTNCAW